MRKLIGGAVIVVGVGVLGWYGTTRNAKTMQADVTEGAAAAAQGTIHPISTSVSGRDIAVSGVANGPAERDQIVALMNDVSGRRVVTDDLTVLETASPFALSAIKTSEGLAYEGVIPTEVDRATLTDRIGAAAGDLKLMAGAPDGNWTGVVGQGLDGLDVLEDGTMSVSGQEVSVTGTALTPTEDAAVRAALAELPEGYATTFDITVLDDGTPLRLSLGKSEDGAVTSTGKIPATLETAELTEALSAEVGEGIEQSVLPPANAGWPEASKTGAAALGKLVSGEMQMTEDMLSVTGVATPDGKAEAESLLASMPEGITATSAIALYDDGKPFSLEMVSDGTTTTAKGKFPAEIAAADVVGDVPAGDIRNAFISDDTQGFGTVAGNGVQALAQLEEGSLSVIGTEVTLTGVARTPTEQSAATDLLGNLPEGYNATFDITARDDGTPPNFDVVYMAGEGATVAGKLPAGTAVADIAGALDIQTVTGEPVSGLIGDGAQAQEKLAVVSSWLPELEQLTFNSNDDAITVDAIASPGVNQDLVQSGLAEALGDGASVSVAALSDLPAEGTTRTNQSTRRFETFSNGYWLPVFDFTSSADNCNTQTTDVLSNSRISFVTGSAQLDAQSVRAINSVASVVRKCLADTDLNVEVGGHTDSQGAEAANQQLSQARAETVRAALVARGVAEAEIVAVGFGEAEPIADNGTAEGRAANRRTTITWFEPVAEAPADQEEAGADDAAAADTETTQEEVGE